MNCLDRSRASRRARARRAARCGHLRRPPPRVVRGVPEGGGELQRAAATLAYSVAPAEPPAELEERVVAAVRDAASRRRAASPRRSRVAAAGVLAAMLALSGLGWGAVMAGRAERAEERAAASRREQREAVRELPRGLQTARSRPRGDREVSTLLSPQLRAGRGDAFVLLSPSGPTTSRFVLVSGLTNVRERSASARGASPRQSARASWSSGQIRTLNSRRRRRGQPCSGRA